MEKNNLGKWLKKLSGAKPAQKKEDEPYVTQYAEKVYVGFENARNGLRGVVFYKHVEQLQETAYIKPVTKDSEGFWIGILPQAVFDDLEHFLSAFKHYKSEGWIPEIPTADPRAINHLKKAGLI